MNLSRERADEVLDEREIVRGAEARAQIVVERAQQEASKIKADADDYVIAVLSHLEAQLGGLLATVQNGIRVVGEGRTDSESMGTREEPSPAS